MKTIEDAVALIKEIYPDMVETGPNNFFLTLRTSESRLQNIYIELNDVYVIYSSVFARSEQITPAQALEIAQGTIYGITYSEPNYMIRHIGKISTLDTFALADFINEVVVVADVLESRISDRDIN